MLLLRAFWVCPLDFPGFLCIVTQKFHAQKVGEKSKSYTFSTHGVLIMGSHTDKERKICGGKVVIYQRTDVQNTTWHCRIRFKNQPYIRQSLDTTDEKEAERLATKLYEDYRMPIRLTHTPTTCWMYPVARI
jgi:hypothetical protein